jgi:hypothetical protein
MRTLKIFSLILLFSITFVSTYSQTLYKIKSYEMCNLNEKGEDINCKRFTGTSLFEYFKVDPQVSIEFKYVDKPEVFKTTWSEKNVYQNENGMYFYKLLDNYPGDKESYIIATLYFDKKSDKLLVGYYHIAQSNIPVTCKLYIE